MQIFSGFVNSPIGYISIKANDLAVYSIQFVESVGTDFENEIITLCKQQLYEYFNGIRTNFTIPISYNLSAFATQVLRECLAVSYGTTVTYSYIANTISNPKATRAVGQSLHKNPLPIIIPCHRVLHKNAAIQGYSGEIWRKKILLEIEKNV